jgi:hypothetical protein
MVSIRASIIVLIILIGSVMVFSYHSLTNDIPANQTIDTNLSISNTTSGNTSLAINVSNASVEDVDPVLPPRETILNGINWSNYPLLRNPYLHNYMVSEPTEVVNHTFLYVTIIVEITDKRNETEVLRQLSGADVELQKILGPDSGPNIYGTVEGVLYYAAIMPYETKVYARAFH